MLWDAAVIARRLTDGIVMKVLCSDSGKVRSSFSTIPRNQASALPRWHKHTVLSKVFGSCRDPQASRCRRPNVDVWPNMPSNEYIWYLVANSLYP